MYLKLWAVLHVQNWRKSIQHLSAWNGMNMESVLFVKRPYPQKDLRQFRTQTTVLIVRNKNYQWKIYYERTQTCRQTGAGYTPTLVIFHAILTYNQNRMSRLADGVVITPSHNPPDDGGFKYNLPTGGLYKGFSTQRTCLRQMNLPLISTETILMFPVLLRPEAYLQPPLLAGQNLTKTE
jgi:hypothetical protein